MKFVCIKEAERPIGRDDWRVGGVVDGSYGRNTPAPCLPDRCRLECSGEASTPVRSTDTSHLDKGPFAPRHVTDDAQPDQIVALKRQDRALGLVPISLGLVLK